MNTAPLKSYAPAARQAFIAAVTAQAARLGITSKETAPATVQGDVLLVNGQAFPRSAESGRNKLIARVKAHGFEATMDAVAYTWFNRLVAIRYMEVHNYLDHGYRVLSDPGGSGRPEILNHAADVDLPGLDRSKVIQLKLDGTKDEELYRLLLMAQCNALHKAMPFLFDKIGDETELLLPANLLHTDSLIRQLVESIEESAWDQIEIIGWLYQYYISEKKDQVIGKVVKSEDIPAATQLFTPNWIVKYMVQNSLGAQWLATYPASPLKSQMEYYIEPAEQTDEVKAQLAAITPAALNPEEITLIDPACGSGHILVEAYDLFKAIYLERGYRERDTAQLILTKNLYGLDIDQRAAQLSGFALMMKGRADDRRLFKQDLKLNVMAMVNSDDLNIAELTHEVKLAGFGLEESDLRELKKLFEHATTFGSLIQVPESFAAKLPALRTLSEAPVGEVGRHAGDMFAAGALEYLGPLVRQAQMLAGRYDNVVANPPYMGGKSMNPVLKAFARSRFPDSKSDLFACFIERGYTLASGTGFHAMVTQQSWMFLSSFEDMRERIVREKLLCTVAHLASGVMGIAFGTASTVLRNFRCPGYIGTFSYVANEDLTASRVPKKFPVENNRFARLSQGVLKQIPGSPLAYWASDALRTVFKGKKISSIAEVKQGLATADDQRFLRRWQEVSLSATSYPGSSCPPEEQHFKWFPFNKGGQFRRWYGNQEFLVNWQHEGAELKAFKPRAVIRNPDFYFRPGITWNQTGSGIPSFRFVPAGFIFAHIGAMAFPHKKECFEPLLGFLNSRVGQGLLAIISPTMGLEVGHISRLPAYPQVQDVEHIKRIVEISRADWNCYEHSWNFQSHPLIDLSLPRPCTIKASFTDWVTLNHAVAVEMKSLEEVNNCLFINACGLQAELTPEVPLEQITLTANPAYRYGIKGTEEERETRFREDSMQELVSYAIGCMMGRYSLDEPGLIYAHSGNARFDPSRYSKFAADEDGILPVTDFAWFADDAASRLMEFISVAWDTAHLEENLTFLADSLSPGRNETSRDTLQRYICDKFFKDHLQTYSNRPIYWLFSSGKQRAFQCLVYLHRYNEGTLARIRSEYVIPLQGKMGARLAHLEDDRKLASSAQQKRIEKESVKLKKQQTELLAFDEKLRHYADRRITLDLDDGVKVNYGKFGSLLAEVATVHGQKAEGP